MTAQIGRGLAIIAAAVVIGLLILSQGYDTDAVGQGDVDVAADDGGSDDAAADDGAAADDAAAADDGAATDGGATDDAADTAADGAATDGAATDGAAADGAAADGTATDGTATDGTATDGATTRPPAEVRILVVNGSGIDGAAGRGRDTLTAQAYTVLGVDNATPAVTGTDAVYYVEGFEAEAAAVAAVLGGGAELLQPMPAESPAANGAQGADVIVVLGPTLATSA